MGEGMRNKGIGKWTLEGGEKRGWGVGWGAGWGSISLNGRLRRDDGRGQTGGPVPLRDGMSVFVQKYY